MRSRGVVDGAIIIIAAVTKYSLRDLLLTEAQESEVEVGRSAGGSSRVVDCYDAAAARCASGSLGGSLGAGIADDANCGYSRVSHVPTAGWCCRGYCRMQAAASRYPTELLTCCFCCFLAF